MRPVIVCENDQCSAICMRPAVTTPYNQAQLETSWETTNVNGGAMALGRPYGTSGVRHLG